MNHRKWSAYIWSTMSYNDLMSEHNTLYADWKKSSLEAEHLAKVNGDLCDRIAELESRPVLTWEECEKEWMRLRGSMEDGVPIQNRKFLAWLQSRLPAPIRVPFPDAQIEKMAEAHMGVLNPFANWEHTDKQYRMNAIRAALAAGGVERASDEELLDIYEAADRDSDAIIAVRSRVEAPLLVEIQRLEEAGQFFGAESHRHLVMLQKAENTCAELLAELDAVNERAEQAEAERDDLRCESSLIGELRTILGLGWGESITERCRELAALRAELRAVTAECKHLNVVIADMQPVDATPTDAQVEALARVLDTAYETEVGGHTPWRDQSPCHQDRRRAQARAAYAHIGRVPVGAELDVTADVIEVIARSSSRQTRAKEILDLCRSRIRPTYECKECAKLVNKIMKVNEIDGRPIAAEFNAAKDKAFEAQEALNEAINEMGLGLRAALVARADIRAALEGE